MSRRVDRTIAGAVAAALPSDQKRSPSSASGAWLATGYPCPVPDVPTPANGPRGHLIGREERVAHLLDLLYRQSSATNRELQAVTGASEVTIRRDLVALQREGLVRRTRGGAVLHATTSPTDEAFELRRRRNAAAKGALAVAAADLVTDHTVVLLGDGTTLFAFAEELARRRQPLLIATPAINLAARLAEVETFEVIVLGGQLRGASFGSVGPLTIAALKSIKADIAFVSPDRLGLDGPIFNTFADAEVADAMAGRAARLVVMADSSKFAPGGSAILTPWERVDDLITEGVVPALADRLAEAAVQVTIARSPAAPSP